MLVLEENVVDNSLFAFRQTAFPIHTVDAVTRGEGFPIFDLKHPGLSRGLGGFLRDLRDSDGAGVGDGWDLFELLLHFINN